MSLSPRTFFLLATLGLLAACEPTDDSGEVVDMDGLELSIDEAVDGIDAEEDPEFGAEDDSSDVLMEMEFEEADDSLDRPSRREIVKRLLRRLAQDEPCALRGVIAGRYRATDDEDFDGDFRGRAYRRDRQLVGVGAGTWTSFGEPAPAGAFDGSYLNFEGNTGELDGEYGVETVQGRDVGTLTGTWVPSDGSHDGGNLGGLWHPTRDGRGVFLSYWSRCDLEPRHTGSAS